MKGVISFVVASVFLLVLVSSAAKIAERAPDYSYQQLFAAHVQHEAVKAAFSDALSEAGRKALVASQALGAEAPSAVKAALYTSALDFEAQLHQEGYDAAFWCGKASEQARQEASEEMAAEGASVLPQGALPLSDPACAAEFDVNLLRNKAILRSGGFSIYSHSIGYAVQLPENYEVDMNG